jgi:hypothetical protein
VEGGRHDLFWVSMGSRRRRKEAMRDASGCAPELGHADHIARAKGVSSWRLFVVVHFQGRERVVCEGGTGDAEVLCAGAASSPSLGGACC